VSSRDPQVHKVTASRPQDSGLWRIRWHVSVCGWSSNYWTLRSTNMTRCPVWAVTGIIYSVLQWGWLLIPGVWHTGTVASSQKQALS